MPAETPIFVRTIFPKQIVASFFYLPNTIVFAYFLLKMPFYQKILHNHPKTLFFCFFWSCPFHFYIFSIFFSQHTKKTKTKSWHPNKQPTKVFSHPLHTIVFLRYPKNTIKLGKNTQSKIQILDQVLTLQHIYNNNNNNSNNNNDNNTYYIIFIYTPLGSKILHAPNFLFRELFRPKAP